METLSGRNERRDRSLLAALVAKHKSRIIRRLRGKLRAAGVTAFDEEDIFSTCARRLDLMHMDRRLKPMSEEGLVSYTLRMAMNIASNRIRAEQRRQRTLQRLFRESVDQLSHSPAEPDEQVLDALMNQLDEDDRRLLQLRLDGRAHIHIANALGISIAAERSRWQRLRKNARALLALPPVSPPRQP